MEKKNKMLSPNDNNDILLKIVGILVILVCLKLMISQQTHAHPEYELDCPICVQELCVNE